MLRMLLRLSFFVCFLLPSMAKASYWIIPDHMKIGGYAQWYQIGGGDQFNLNHQGYFRRARLALTGNINHYLNYMAEYDFAYHGDWRNLWINYHNKANDIRLGQFRVPFNAVFNQSSRYLWFAERPLPVNAFNPNFRRGASYQFIQPKWQLAASVFVPGSQTQSKIQSPFGSTQRVLWVPWQQKDRLLQLGLGNWYQHVNSPNTLSYGTIPEASGYITVRTVNTGTISQVDNFDVVNADLLFQYKRFASDMGYLYNITYRKTNTDLHFKGWYADFSYFLNDNYFRYNTTNGLFAAPNNMQKAFQAAARFSDINLNDNGFSGGKEFNTTLALNAYFFKHFKVGFDYIFANISKSTTTTNGHDNIIMLSVQTMM